MDEKKEIKETENLPNINSANISQKKGVIDYLRDPIWQFVGVLIALVGLFVPNIVSYFSSNSEEKKEAVIKLIPATPLNLLNSTNISTVKPQLFIDGKEEKDVRLLTFQFIYNGTKPLETKDFVESIQGKLIPGRKIIAANKSTRNLASRINENSSKSITLNHRRDIILEVLEINQRRPIDFEFTIINDRIIQIKPLLMNPGDSFSIDIYTSFVIPDTKSDQPVSDRKSPQSTPVKTVDYPNLRDAMGNFSPGSEFGWTCRVIGITCPVYVNSEVLPKNSSELFLDISIVGYSGWALWFIILFNAINLVLFMIGISYANKSQSITVFNLCTFFIAAISSLMVSEIVADWIFNGNNLFEQDYLAFITFIFHILLFTFLSRSILRAIFNKVRKSQIDAV
jgi:hypothetical protein